MDIRAAYRGMPNYFAMPLAFLASVVVASVLAAVGAALTDFVFSRRGLDGPGAGVLLILIVLNVAVSAFITSISIFVNLHHRTSWRAPTLAFAFCIVLIPMQGPLDIQFAPLVLGVGAVTWLASCWVLRRKPLTHSGAV